MHMHMCMHMHMHMHMYMCAWGVHSASADPITGPSGATAPAS